MGSSRFLATLVGVAIAFVGGGALVHNWDQAGIGRMIVGPTDSGTEARRVQVADAGGSHAVGRSADGASGTLAANGLKPADPLIRLPQTQTGTAPLEQPEAVRMRKGFSMEQQGGEQQNGEPQDGTAAGPNGGAAGQGLPADDNSGSLGPGGSLAPNEGRSLLRFDRVNVAPSGQAAIDGRAPAGWQVEIERNGMVVANVEAGADGRFAVAPVDRLAPGDHVLQLKARAPDGTIEAISQQQVAIAVPQTASQSADEPRTQLAQAVPLDQPRGPQPPMSGAAPLEQPITRPIEAQPAQQSAAPPAGQAPADGQAPSQARDSWLDRILGRLAGEQQPQQQQPGAADQKPANQAAAKQDPAETAVAARPSDRQSEQDPKAPAASKGGGETGPTAAGALALLSIDAADVVKNGGSHVLKLSGLAAPGAQIRLTLGNRVVGNAVAAADGAWQFASRDARFAELAEPGASVTAEWVDPRGGTISRETRLLVPPGAPGDAGRLAGAPASGAGKLASEATAADKAAGAKPATDKASGDKATTDKANTGKTAQVTAPARPEKPAGQTVAGKTAAGQTKSGQTKSGQTVVGQTVVGQTGASQSAAAKPTKSAAVNRPTRRAHFSERAFCQGVATKARRYRYVKTTHKTRLWTLAQRYYGRGAAYPTIYCANRRKLSHPDRVPPGLVLAVPIRRVR